MVYKVPILKTTRLILNSDISLENYLKVNEFRFLDLYGIRGEIKFVKNNSEEYKKVFEENKNKTYENSMRWYIYLQDSLEIIGILGVHNVIDSKKADLMIHIHPDYWGKGYAKETLLEILDYVFNELHFSSINYNYDEGNEKSKKLCKALGFELVTESITDYEDGYYNKVKIFENILTKEKFEAVNSTLKKDGDLSNKKL